MKLIIEIPDEDYRFIKKLRYWVGGRCGYKTIQCNVINAIKNGTPYEPMTVKERIANHLSNGAKQESNNE